MERSCNRRENVTWRYQQVEGGYQPNGHVNQHMLSWAAGDARRNSDDLLELLCGNGNFTRRCPPASQVMAY